jgi:2-amino-4-hydroxy-6-hydroxymethyldihydropteridine diphosphokinase
MTHAAIGMGANLGAPHATLKWAVVQLATLPRTRLLAVSGAYASAPLEVSDTQADYINAVALLDTTLPASDLLARLLAIELQAGRARPYWHAPRLLDLDILLYGDAMIDTPTLAVPHPRLTARAFALLPLAEVAPDMPIPGHSAVRSVLPTVAHQAIRRLGPL